MDDTVAVALFRHGLTEANKSHAYLGWTDSPLCQEHREKLAAAPQYYCRIFASDLGRCMKTAAILFPDHSIESCPEWREMHFGEWEGRTYQELKDNPAYQKWLENPFSGVVPGGESFSAFTARVAEFNRSIASEGYARCRSYYTWRSHKIPSWKVCTGEKRVLGMASSVWKRL